MNKKKLILIPALLMALTSCGPTSAPTTAPTDPSVDPTVEPTVDPTTDPSVDPTVDPTTDPSVDPVVTGVEITNKADISAEWFVGGEDRNVNYKVSYSDGTSKSRGAEITTSDAAVVSLPGGVKIHAAGKGTATITVTAGEFSDSVEITVSELNKEETVTVAELLTKPVNNATAYIVTGYIVQFQYADSANAGAYGNFYLADSAEAKAEDGILVYGATEHADSLKYDDATKTWSWGNPNSENPKRPFPFENYKIGDKITMKGLRLDYNTTKEFNGIITDHVPVQKDEVTSVEFKSKVTTLGNGYSYAFSAVDNNGDSDVTLAITAGDAATLDGNTLVADPLKTGVVTITATSNVKADVKASIDVEIVANPEIINATLADVINDEGTKGAKLWRVEVKTVANDKTNAEDVYGNFDYTDGTNTITSYGLSASPSSISYYNDVWNFKNDKTFANTGVEVGSDKTYTVVVMRSDYKGTKQLVGYIEQTFEPTTQDVTVEELLAAEPSKTVAYNVKGYIKSYYKANADVTKYINFELASSMTAESTITVYGATKSATALKHDKYLNTFTFTNTKDANPDDYMLGDYVEMTVLRTVYTDYNNNSFQQCEGIITKHDAVRPEFISLIGSFNEWNGDLDFTGSKGGKYWTVEDVELEANTEFKVRRDHQWSTAEVSGYDWGFANVTVGTDLVSDANGNIKVNEAGKYNINFNFETKGIEIYKQATGEVTTATASLSFADKANRTAYSTSQQVWEQNGVKLTNNKSKSTSNVGDYANPLRLYQGSEVIIEHANNMTEIEITIDTNKPIGDTVTSISSVAGVTVTKEGTNIVRVTFANPVSSLTFSAAKQIRWKSIVVTYIA